MPARGEYKHSDGALLGFSEEFRCQARAKHSDPPGQRCKRRAVPHMRVCVKHGGAAKQVRETSNRKQAVERMRKLVTPIPGTDFEANPIAAFELEFRRTIARIRYLDDVIAALEPDALGWGKTEETVTTSTEFPGVDTKFQATINVYYDLQARERKHLVELIKVWINAKLDVRKLEVEEQKVNALNGVIEVVLTRLGHNIHDPEIRRTVRTAMLELPVAGNDAAAVVVTAKDIAQTGNSLVGAAVAEAIGRPKQRGPRKRPTTATFAPPGAPSAKD